MAYDSVAIVRRNAQRKKTRKGVGAQKSSVSEERNVITLPEKR